MMVSGDPRHLIQYPEAHSSCEETKEISRQEGLFHRSIFV